MNLITFDSILEKKVGFGKYQYTAYLFAGLTQFSDGSEIVGLSILLPILKNEWSITDDQQGILGSILFFGIFFGSILGGYVSDILGRRTALLYSSLILFILGVASTLVNSVATFIIIRGLFGLVIGFTIPLGPSLASELTPVNIRGRSIVAVNAFFSLGSFYAVIVAKLCLDSLESGDWQAMLIWCSIPSLIVYIGTWRFIKESPRYLIAVDRLEEAIEVLNYMASVNKPELINSISQEEIDDLKFWQSSIFKKDQTSHIRSLFSIKYKRITILLGIMWFTLNYVYYGMTFILPFILSKLETTTAQGTQGLDGLFYTIAGEVPSIVIGLYIIEKESFGRKGTIIYSSLITLFLFFYVYITSGSFLIIFLMLGRMLIKLNFSMMYPLSTEFFPTTFRTVGLGFTSGLGRLGASIMPYSILGLFKVDVFLPILAFAIVTALNGIAAFMLPYDTRGRQLDLIEDDHENKKSDKQVLVAMMEL